MKSKTYLKLVPVLILIVAFIIFSDYAKEEAKTSIEIDSEKFTVVDSEDELNMLLSGQSRYNQDLLLNVEKYNLMTKIEDVKIPLIDEQRDFRIESIWNNRLELILTYSFNVLPSDEDPESIPYLRVNELSFHPDEVDPLNMKVQTHNQVGGNYWPNDGVVFGNRLYRRTILIPALTGKAYEHIRNWSEGTQDLDKAVELFHHINLKGVELVTKKEDGELTQQVEDIAIDYRFMNANPVLENYELNQSVQLNEQSSVTYREYEKRLYRDRIYLSLQTEPELSTLIYRMNGIRGSNTIQEDGAGNHYIEMSNYLGQSMDDIQFSLLSGLYTTDDELKFTIEKEHIQAVQKGENERQLDQKLGEIHDVSFRLDDIRNIGGTFEDVSYVITLTVETMADDRDLHFRIYNEKDEHAKRFYRCESVDRGHGSKR